jgi:hypothetical protein
MAVMVTLTLKTDVASYERLHSELIKAAVPEGLIFLDAVFQGHADEPEQILSRNKITLSYGYYEDAFDGMLEHQSGRFHVYANLQRLKAKDSGRARFTSGLTRRPSARGRSDQHVIEVDPLLVPLDF